MSTGKAKFSHPIPSALADRPVDRRGYPIPYAAWLDPKTGEYDFRVIDPQKKKYALEHRICAVSGLPLIEGQYWFIGGIPSFKARLFTDGPMLKEVAEFSVCTCPHLAIPAAGYRKAGLEQAHEQALQSTDKHDVVMLGMAADFEIVVVQEREFIRATPWKAVNFWRAGEIIKKDEARGLLLEHGIELP
jgi:hypothetical protein